MNKGKEDLSLMSVRSGVTDKSNRDATYDFENIKDFLLKLSVELCREDIQLNKDIKSSYFEIKNIVDDKSKIVEKYKSYENEVNKLRSVLSKYEQKEEKYINTRVEAEKYKQLYSANSDKLINNKNLLEEIRCLKDELKEKEQQIKNLSKETGKKSYHKSKVNYESGYERFYRFKDYHEAFKDEDMRIEMLDLAKKLKLNLSDCGWVKTYETLCRYFPEFSYKYPRVECYSDSD